jgi:ABC-type amino acid transport system permease subunit
MYRAILAVITILSGLYTMAMGASILVISLNVKCPASVSFVRNTGVLLILLGLYMVVKQVKKCRSPRQKRCIEHQADHIPDIVAD